ncbi:MAG: protein-disulfide reductase DsbD domain-containing protein [Gemmobacter sp.]
MRHPLPLIFSAAVAGWTLCVPAARAQEGLEAAAILDGWDMGGGVRMAALRLDLAPGWKTYWRSPGEGGIPPLFDWSASDNLGAVRVHWPLPEVWTTNGLRAIGYGGTLILPIEVRAADPGRPVVLAVLADIGVCADICQPARVAVGPVSIGGAPGPEAEAIAAALADRPAEGAAAGVARATCRTEPMPGGLRLVAELVAPALGPEEVAVIEADAPDLWLSEARAHRDGPVLRAEAEVYPTAGGGVLLDRERITITVLAAGRGYEWRGCGAG